MISVYWQPNGSKVRTKLNIVSCTWSGTENQASRTLEFTVPWNPYDKGFQNTKLKLADRVFMYESKKLLFAGVITSREKTAQIGTASFTALDYMHYLLRSSVTRFFKGFTPKFITKSLCNEYGIKTGAMENPNIALPLVVYKEKPVYDIIVAVYRKAYAYTKKKYMPVMAGSYFTVILKGTSSGVTLDQNVDIINATYHDTSENMVNHVQVYVNDYYKHGDIKAEKSIAKYGMYTQPYTYQGDPNWEKEAKALMQGVTKEASIEALGNTACVAGKSLKIKDKATGIVGKFYITSDSHSFQNGIHTMRLELSQTNAMEEGAEEDDSYKNKLK